MKNPPEEAAMSQTYRTLRVARSDEGVLSVVIDAPPMNLIGPELVRDLVALLGELESDQDTRVMVLESADPEYFVPHVDLTKVAEYTAEAVRSTKRVLNDLTLPGADEIRADARRFHQLVGSDTVKARTATLFAQGLQTRGPLELDLGDRIGSLLQNESVLASAKARSTHA